MKTTMNDASNLILKCFLHTSRLLVIAKLTFLLFFLIWAHCFKCFLFSDFGKIFFRQKQQISAFEEKVLQ